MPDDVETYAAVMYHLWYSRLRGDVFANLARAAAQTSLAAPRCRFATESQRPSLAAAAIVRLGGAGVDGAAFAFTG